MLTNRPIGIISCAMGKGENTKQRIIERTGVLMNQKGYLATPVSEILEASDIKKGGLYNHFESKDQLALEAFQANTKALGEYLGSIARRDETPEKILWALIEASLDVASGKIVPGGCPVLNAGTEADDLSEPLRTAAAASATALKQYFLRPLQELKKSGSLKPEFTPENLAMLLVCTVEGGILWARVTRKPEQQAAVLGTLRQLLGEAVR